MGKLLKFDEKFKVEHVVGENRVQKIVKATFEVPEEKPDIYKILEVKTSPRVNKKKIVNRSKVLVEGTIDSKLIYVAETLDAHDKADPVHAFHGQLPFSEAVHIDNVMHDHVSHPMHDHDLSAQVSVRVEDVSWRIIDSRTVEVEVVIEIFVKLVEYVQVRLLTDLKGIGVVADRRRLKLESVINEGTTQKIVRREFEIPEQKPDIEQIVEVDSNIEIIDKKVIKNKVLFEGEVTFKVLYVADTLDSDQPVHSVTFRAVFTHFIELQGVCPGHNVHIMPTIETVLPKIVNSRKLRFEAVIEFFVKVTETKQTYVVTNAFGEEDIRLEKLLLKVQEVVAEDTKQINENFDVTLANERDILAEGPDIEKIVSVDAEAKVKDYEVIEDKVIIEGVIKLGVLFVANTLEGDQPVYFSKFYEPFTLFIDLPGAEPGMDVMFKTWVEDVSWRLIDSFTINFDVIVKVFAKVTETKQLQVVIDAEMEDC